MYLSFNNFINKKIEQTLINDFKDDMYWKVDGQWYILKAYGDCCSRSWYEHCDNASALQNATLLEFEEVHLGGSDHEDYTYLRTDIFKFKTDKGHCTIEFRNESNGYYSGWCEICAIDREVKEGDVVGSRRHDTLSQMKDF